MKFKKKRNKTMSLQIGTIEVEPTLLIIRANRKEAEKFIKKSMDQVNKNLKQLVVENENDDNENDDIEGVYFLNEECAHLLEPTTQLLKQIEDVADLFNLQYYISGSVEYDGEPDYYNMIGYIENKKYKKEIQDLHKQLENMWSDSRAWNTSTC